jgi:predicted phage-related endonuclease
MYRILTFTNREEWLRARCDFITSTDVAALFGRERSWMSLRKLWSIKRNKIIEPEGNSPEAAHGNRMQPLIAEDFEAATKLRLFNPGSWTLFVRDDCQLACSVDYLVRDSWRINECKTAWRDQARLWDTAVPLENQLQIEAQMGVIEPADMGYFSAWLYKGGPPLFRLHPIERDNEVIEEIKRRTALFWELVDEDRPPPVDGSPATAEALRHQYRHPLDEEIQLETPVLLDQRRQLNVIRDAIDDLEIQRQQLSQTFMDALGPHTVARLADGMRVWWKPDRKGSRRLRFE